MVRNMVFHGFNELEKKERRWFAEMNQEMTAIKKCCDSPEEMISTIRSDLFLRNKYEITFPEVFKRVYWGDRGD